MLSEGTVESARGAGRRDKKEDESQSEDLANERDLCGGDGDGSAYRRQGKEVTQASRGWTQSQVRVRSVEGWRAAKAGVSRAQYLRRSVIGRMKASEKPVRLVGWLAGF